MTDVTRPDIISFRCHMSIYYVSDYVFIGDETSVGGAKLCNKSLHGHSNLLTVLLKGNLRFSKKSSKSMQVRRLDWLGEPLLMI